jgi:hypothetical protein
MGRGFSLIRPSGTFSQREKEIAKPLSPWERGWGEGLAGTFSQGEKGFKAPLPLGEGLG